MAQANETNVGAAATATPAKEVIINAELKLESLPEVAGFVWTAKNAASRTVKVVDADGNAVVGDDGKQVTSKNPTVRVPLLVPTKETLLALISADEKIADMVLSLVTGEIYSAAKSQLDELFAAKVVPTVDKLDYDQLQIHAVAAEYASSGRKGIAQEQYDEFIIAIGAFWAENNVEENKIKARQDVFRRKFQQIKSNKDLCGAMRAMLAQFVEAKAEVAGEHSDVIKAYDSLLERYVNAQERDLTASLL